MTTLLLQKKKQTSPFVSAVKLKIQWWWQFFSFQSFILGAQVWGLNFSDFLEIQYNWKRLISNCDLSCKIESHADGVPNSFLPYLCGGHHSFVWTLSAFDCLDGMIGSVRLAMGNTHKSVWFSKANRNSTIYSLLTLVWIGTDINACNAM